MPHQSIEPGDGILFRADTALGTTQMEGTVERVEGDTIWLRGSDPLAAKRSRVERVYKGGLPGTVLGGPLEDDL